MNRVAFAVGQVAAIMLASGCAHDPRLDAAWYVTPPPEDPRVTIWLVNRDSKPADVLEIRLNRPEGFALKRVKGEPLPARLDTGETLLLSAGKPACACGPDVPEQTSPLPPEPSRGCLPVRLFVQTRYGQKRLQSVEIDHPLPSSYAPEVLLSCP
ncbi:MAG TPA: hypothetical protein VNT42_10500 [Sphingomonas sp.]|nr:hypothetical protein [Sphingomonas sp.]